MSRCGTEAAFHLSHDLDVQGQFAPSVTAISAELSTAYPRVRWEVAAQRWHHELHL